MKIEGLCPHCKVPFAIESTAFTENCTACQKPVFTHLTELCKDQGLLNQCPICGTEHVYRQKDFNRAVGVAMLVVGIGLAYFTYGISLLLVTVIDWIIARKVGEVGICYRCRACFRGPTISKLETFNLSLHDYYKNLPPW